MISYTLENAFILAIFQLLISGLILCSSGAVHYLSEDRSARNTLRLAIAAFLLYSLYFLLRAAFSYRGLSLAAPALLPGQYEFAIQAIEKAALAFLGFSYLSYRFPENLRLQLYIVAAGVVILFGSSYLVHRFLPSLTGAAFVNGVWLAAVCVLCFGRKHFSRKDVASAAALCVLAAAHFLRSGLRGVGEPQWLWWAENAALLIGLGLFALAVETRSSHLSIRFFLRLNLIFIGTASMLILIIAESERREHLNTARSEAGELTEIVRGSLIYSYLHGVQAEEALSRPEIVHKVTSSFGSLTDLRRVRVSYEGWGMEMSIGPDWVVSQKIYRETSPDRPAPWSDEPTQMATLSPIPVVFEGRSLGRIELDESLQTINYEVARHMGIIFSIFTAAVFIAAGLFGFTVQRTQKTIQRQFEELEKTHEQMAHVERLALAGQLAGGVAHEINNPAGIILTTSDYLLRQADTHNPPDGLKEDLEAIRRQARRISNIVSSLLTFSRPTLLHKRPTDINSVIQQSLSLMGPRFREKSVETEQQLAPHLPAILADPDQLEQVFVNLLNNAVEAMPNGGRVSVETRTGRDDGQPSVEVLVADTGTGIAEEHLKRIFDPFFSTKPRGRGTGLGLSVSHGIIRDHRGHFEVDSQVGHGTVFRVYLPLEEETREKL